MSKDNFTGRPTKYTPATVEKITDALRGGNTRRACGIDEDRMKAAVIKITQEKIEAGWNGK
jgi:hypothetical protein